MNPLREPVEVLGEPVRPLAEVRERPSARRRRGAEPLDARILFVMRLFAPLAPLLVSLAGLSACTPASETYQTQVELRRMAVVERDAKGAPLAVVVELEYPDCPGEQAESFQEDAAFAQCIGKYKQGDKLPATLSWEPVGYGHFDSEVDKVGDCARSRDAAESRSYEVVEQCSDVVVNGIKVGFHCDRKPTKALLDKCPWFRRS